MAIFSLRHTWLGKSHKDYKPGVGKAHANYVTRQSSCTKVFGARAPTDRQTLKAWLNNEEVSDRKNARIIDKLMVALPIELTAGQHAALVRDFCERVTEGRASWIAAVHDRGEDAHNPHVHIILRDRDIDTGRRVMMTTERGSTERFRQAWEETANDALRDAGLSIRIDRRSLAEQGVERDTRYRWPDPADMIINFHKDRTSGPVAVRYPTGQRVNAVYLLDRSACRNASHAGRNPAERSVPRLMPLLIHCPALPGMPDALMPDGRLVKKPTERAECITWWRNGKLHRDPSEGPARHFKSNDQEWSEYYRDGKLHRDPEDGPAAIAYDRDGAIIEQQFWVNGEKLEMEPVNG
jgi:hypothetical protein